MVRSKAFVVRTTALGLLVVVAVVIAVVARGGDGGSAAAQPTTAMPRIAVPKTTLVKASVAPSVGYGKIANCRPAVRALSRPADLPDDFPLPRGTVITDVQRPTVAGGPPFMYIWGQAPLSLRAASGFFVRELRRLGFFITQADAEPGEEEARFNRNGRRGGWKVNSLLGCPRNVLVLVGVELPRT